ncbi:DUF6634 family protein [Microvirga calopogonii]|uniref:DUF6634 family protein n=1 Tax=Microvirga calopogonii TaxID=2078013 RepID=UPI000E0CC898|nr:DUF6634 family protein [Microvirga calopogonii]
MIMIGPDGAFDRRRVEREIERLESLARDLRRLLDEGPSTAADYPDAPVIHGWRAHPIQVMCLIGAVSGHPDPLVGKPGRITATSDLWVFDPARGLARTLSRVYRLGAPHRDESAAGTSIH